MTVASARLVRISPQPPQTQHGGICHAVVAPGAADVGIGAAVVGAVVRGEVGSWPRSVLTVQATRIASPTAMTAPNAISPTIRSRRRRWIAGFEPPVGIGFIPSLLWLACTAMAGMVNI